MDADPCLTSSHTRSTEWFYLPPDWNCTPSANPLKKNPDVINMVSLPNLTHSKQLAALMEKFELCDIYRCYNPVRSDFTFIPKCKERKNRSRIDFILISDSIVKFSHSSDISPGVPNSLFDHKSVFVNFFKKACALIVMLVL